MIRVLNLYLDVFVIQALEQNGIGIQQNLFLPQSNQLSTSKVLNFTPSSTIRINASVSWYSFWLVIL